jgi:hypothetical protein
MPRQKTTVYLDQDVLTATKAAALTSRRSESAVIEDALRSYLASGHGERAREQLGSLLDRVARGSDLDEESAMALAIEEVHAVRRARNAKRSSAKNPTM